MALKFSTGLKNSVLATGSLKAALASSEIRIFAGPVPASADDATTGATLLNTIKNAGAAINFDTAASGGILAKAPGETWQSNNAATGTASFYRHVLAADTDNSSGSALRIQGTVGTVGADLNLTSTALSSGAPQAIDFYTVAVG